MGLQTINQSVQGGLLELANVAMDVAFDSFEVSIFKTTSYFLYYFYTFLYFYIQPFDAKATRSRKRGEKDAEQPRGNIIREKKGGAVFLLIIYDFCR